MTSATLPPELANQPLPLLVEEIDYEVLLADKQAKAIANFAAIDIPYDVATLETDPAQPLLEASAYGDMLLRQRINEAIRSWFLAFTTGSDLDAMAQWYDVSRLLGETDIALKRRVVLAIQGRSTGGTEARYRSVALGANVRVADAAVYTEGKDPTIHVAIFSTDNGGVADPMLIAEVNAALQAPTVRMVNDTIVVASAAQLAVSVTANVRLLPQAPASVLTDMQASLATAWARDMVLGRDLTRSWLLARLQVEGVHSVELVAPVADIAMPFNQAAALGAVSITTTGRDY